MGKVLKVKILESGTPVPGYAYEGDAGLDLVSAEEFLLGPGERRLVSTGLAIELERGHAGLVLPRSGLAVKHGISLVNTPGLIDSQYRGEVKVILINHDLEEAYSVNKGDRIAQLIVVSAPQIEVEQVEELSDTTRSEGGFGSSGK